MPQLQPLNPTAHKSIRVNTQYSTELGYDCGAVMVVPNEISTLQREYPILFRKHTQTGRLFPNALLGFEQNENLFLTHDGHWNAKTIPLLIQKGPFMITPEHQGSEQKAILALDLDDPRIGSKQGKALFDELGNETPFLSEVKQVMAGIHEGSPLINLMVDTYMEMDLIEPLTLDIELNDGQKIHFAGAYTVSEEKLADLSPQQLEKLNETGLLAVAFYIAGSLQNVSHLIELKNATLSHCSDK